MMLLYVFICQQDDFAVSIEMLLTW